MKIIISTIISILGAVLIASCYNYYISLYYKSRKECNSKIKLAKLSVILSCIITFVGLFMLAYHLATNQCNYTPSTDSYTPSSTSYSYSSYLTNRNNATPLNFTENMY